MNQVAGASAHLFVVLEVQLRARQLGSVLISLRLAWHAGCRTDSYHDNPVVSFIAIRRFLAKQFSRLPQVIRLCFLVFIKQFMAGAWQAGNGLHKPCAPGLTAEAGTQGQARWGHNWEIGQHKTMVST